MDRNTKILKNDDLLRKIVYCVQKAVGEDLLNYLRENRRETNNAVRQLRGDNINTNLKTHVVKDCIELLSFERCGWEGRMIIDHNDCITYSILTEATLSGIPKKKKRKSPHYLQSFLFVENYKCIPKTRQMTLDDFGVVVFDTDVLKKDFENINKGLIDVEKNYRHYIVAYKAERGQIKDIKLKFLDKDFNIVDEESLIQYIKPDFAQLSEVVSYDNKDMSEDTDKKALVAIRSDIKPKLRKKEKKA